MPESITPWIGDIHKILPPHWAGMVCTLAAVLCGAVIGIERQRAQKPAGLRTLILICLGSAIFAQASIIMSGDHADRTRIAAQVVSGIGFLGAGAIIRERGIIVGVTTGAGIWATSAVGIVAGAGYVAASLFFSFLIFSTLGAARYIDRIVSGPCRMSTMHLEFDPTDGRTRIQIQAVLDEHQHPDPPTFEERPGGPSVAHIGYCQTHRDHRTGLADLLGIPGITRVWHG